MGWARGSDLAGDAWDLVRDYIPKDKLKDVANDFIELFEMMDCDTIQEAELLWSDADREIMCWQCDKHFNNDDLNEDGLCYDCEE